MKETMEVLDLIKVLAACYADAKRDGVVNFMDIPKFVPALEQLFKALEGADKIESELRQLDIGKVLLIGEKFKEIAAAVKG